MNTWIQPTLLGIESNFSVDYLEGILLMERAEFSGRRILVGVAILKHLFISYDIIISWLYTVNGFRIIFFLRDSANQELST